jgi:hypothetical protein
MVLIFDISLQNGFIPGLSPIPLLRGRTGEKGNEFPGVESATDSYEAHFGSFTRWIALAAGVSLTFSKWVAGKNRFRPI